MRRCQHPVRDRSSSKAFNLCKASLSVPRHVRVMRLLSQSPPTQILLSLNARLMPQDLTVTATAAIHMPSSNASFISRADRHEILDKNRERNGNGNLCTSCTCRAFRDVERDGWIRPRIGRAAALLYFALAQSQARGASCLAPMESLPLRCGLGRLGSLVFQVRVQRHHRRPCLAGPTCGIHDALVHPRRGNGLGELATDIVDFERLSVRSGEHEPVRRDFPVATKHGERCATKRDDPPAPTLRLTQGEDLLFEVAVAPA